jgi:dipeptidyl aminopeptidase/acylaminoacyl peptidase
MVSLITLALLAASSGGPAQGGRLTRGQCTADDGRSGEGAREYRDVVISPDATRVADIETAGGRDWVVVRSSQNGAIIGRVSPCGKGCRLSGLAWSPDGSRLATTADGENGSGSLLTVNPSDGTIQTVAGLEGLLQAPRWSPDGRLIAVLMVNHPHKRTGAEEPGRRPVGVISDTAADEQRVAVVPPQGGVLKPVTPADTYVYEYDWTADSQGLVATAAEGNGDANWWAARLLKFNLNGAERLIAAPKVQLTSPRVSADGRTVAFIGGLMSDFGAAGGDIWLARLTGGGARDITPGWRGTFTSIAWRGGEIKASALVGADTALASIDPRTDQVRVLSKSPMSFSAGDGRVSWSADGHTFAASMESFDQPPELIIRAHQEREERILANDNSELKPDLSARSLEWSRGGLSIQGWLLGPEHLSPGERYPLIVQVHGGPSFAWTPSFRSRGTISARTLVEHGYFVLLPNPRGSFGQGEAFVEANKRGFGVADFGDILAGVDAAEKVAPIDDHRLGITGGSYGGFMTMWAVTHTHRFRAAVAGTGVSDWMSYYGENGIGGWMLPYFGASAYDDPKIYDMLSPIRYIRQAETPTFIYAGELDIETPPEQSLEFWHGLKAQGVPTSLVVYAGEGHGIRLPDDRRDLNCRILAWFDKYAVRGSSSIKY